MKKKKNWLEKFQDFWGKLDWAERRDLYKVLQALRGPDVDYKIKGKDRTCAIKLSTTSRIRYEVFNGLDEPYIGFIRSRCENDGVGELDKKYATLVSHEFPRKETVDECRYDHFFEHAEIAYMILRGVNPGCLDDIKEIFE